MLQITNKNKVKSKTIHGPGFSLKVPMDFDDHNEIDPNGRWGYGEFFQTNHLGEGREPQTNLFFYYWKNEKTVISEKETSELIEMVCKEKVFSGDHSLEQDEIFPVHFKRNAGFISKYRFFHQDPEVAGKANFFVFNNPLLEKVVVLGTVIQSIGKQRIENDNMAWMEDQIVATFRFKRNESKHKLPPTDTGEHR
ncbi:MAG TPA: hypothetical protein VK186_17175 [Candidatus Deferrimicrobium sp.]|nr:hypothetical protein [Candidatus Deferrimicrobium sp.]